MLIRDSATVRVREDLSNFKPTHKETRKFVLSILANFPVMLMRKKNGEETLINLHQTSNSLSTIDELLSTEINVGTTNVDPAK